MEKINVHLINGYKINEIEGEEVIITSIDKEGTWSGFDFNLVRYVSEMMTMPVIANGGCGSKEDLKKFSNLQLFLQLLLEVCSYTKNKIWVSW